MRLPKTLALGCAALVSLLAACAAPPSDVDSDSLPITEHPTAIGHGTDLSATTLKDGSVFIGVIDALPGAGGLTGLSLFRASPDGLLDASFAKGDSRVSFDWSYVMNARAAVQADGRIVIAMTTADTFIRKSAVITRRMPDGSLDRSFGDQGYAWRRYDADQYLNLSWDFVAVDATERILAMDSGQNEIVRYLPDGTLDPSFGTGGVQRLPGNGTIPGQPWETLAPIGFGIRADGSIEIAGYARHSNETPTLVVWRLDATGRVVSSFGSSGRLAPPVGANEHYDAFALTDDDAMLFGGAEIVPSTDPATPNGWTGKLAVRRLDPNGAVDASFGTSGLSLVGVDAQDSPSCKYWLAQEASGVTSMVLDSQGRPVIAGQLGSVTVGLRLDRSGAVDGTTGADGPLVSRDLGGSCFESSGYSYAIRGQARTVATPKGARLIATKWNTPGISIFEL